MDGVYFEYPGSSADQCEIDDWAKREIEFAVYLLEEISAGRKAQCAGLIWTVPTCHDWAIEP